MSESQPINSDWIIERGHWDNAVKQYVGRTYERFQRTITMRKELRANGEALVFDGGPTGFEAYYIADLLATGERSEDFCICGGTINSWPRCSVKTSDVFQFIREEN